MILFRGILAAFLLASCAQWPDEDYMTPEQVKALNDKVTASFITSMAVGQSSPGNSIVQADLIPETYTLQFGILDVKPAFPGNAPLPTVQAIINWKVNGQQQRRVISIVSGAAITGVCNGVDVKLVDFPVGGTFTEGMTYKIQATLSRGLRGNVQQPPILRGESRTVVPGIPGQIAVPQDSGVISIFPQIANQSFGPPAPGFFDYQIGFSDASGAALGLYYPLASPGWTPLPPGTQLVTIFSNVLAANPTFATILWGIEG